MWGIFFFNYSPHLYELGCMVRETTEIMCANYLHSTTYMVTGGPNCTLQLMWETLY